MLTFHSPLLSGHLSVTVAIQLTTVSMWTSYNKVQRCQQYILYSLINMISVVKLLVIAFFSSWLPQSPTFWIKRTNLLVVIYHVLSDIQRNLKKCDAGQKCRIFALKVKVVLHNYNQHVSRGKTLKVNVLCFWFMGRRL